MQDKVLIIEDSRSFAKLLQKMLFEHIGIASDVAASKQEANSLLEEHDRAYFAAIVDLNLPDAPKGEATELVVAAKIPAIVFTSTNDQAIKEDLWSRGISDYAHKSGKHSLEYICWIIERLLKNANVKVLVFDRTPNALQHMVKLLHTQRYQVFSASSSADATQLMDTHPDIEVAILDCANEDDDSLELAASLRDRRSRESLEIIGVSTESDRAISAQFIKSGANDFLLKPFIPEEFLCRVNHAVDRIETYTQLQTLNRTKNELLGTAAHDIRGPVGAIKTAVDYILQRNPSAERQQSLLKMVDSSAGGLLDLLSDLLDVSAIESGELKLKLSAENVSELVDERINLYLAQAENKNLRIDRQLGNAIVANIDPVKMRQVVDNLLTNAIKYSPLDSDIRITVDLQGKHLYLNVEDSGSGIPESERSELFTAFKVLSTKATGGEKATGLGLAIVQNVVNAHSGSIRYETSELGGANFCIHLPAN